MSTIGSRSAGQTKKNTENTKARQSLMKLNTLPDCGLCPWKVSWAYQESPLYSIERKCTITTTEEDNGRGNVASIVLPLNSIIFSLPSCSPLIDMLVCPLSGIVVAWPKENVLKSLCNQYTLGQNRWTFLPLFLEVQVSMYFSIRSQMSVDYCNVFYHSVRVYCVVSWILLQT